MFPVAFPVAAARLWNSLPSIQKMEVPPSSAVSVNHISSRFLIPLADSSLSSRSDVILDTIIVITFII